MRIIFSLFTLFLSVVLLQTATGGLAVIDALSGVKLGFTLPQIGLLGSAHYVGFLLGCWVSPALISKCGHIRAFAIFTGAGMASLLLHILFIDPYIWAFCRIFSGIGIAGFYTVVESWIQAKASDEMRGRFTGLYRIIDLVGVLMAQILVGILEPAHYISYAILTFIACLALFPVMITRIGQPNLEIKLKLRPLLPFKRSPLAAVSVIVSGATAAIFRMIGPIYGLDAGLNMAQVGYFIAFFVAGGAIAQYPIGVLADRFARRNVLLGLSFAAILGAGAIAVADTISIWAIYATTTFFGFATFPIYSVAAAHAHDSSNPDENVEISAALVFLFSIGAVISPIFGAYLIDNFGAESLFIFIGVVHLSLILFAALRGLKGPKKIINISYTYIPRTSFIFGQIHRPISRRNQKRHKPPKPNETKPHEAQ